MPDLRPAERLVRIAASHDDEFRVRAQTVCTETIILALLDLRHREQATVLVEAVMEHEPVLAKKMRKLVAAYEDEYPPSDPRQGEL